MKDRRALRILPSVFFALIGCATPSGKPTGSEAAGCAAVLAEPALLREQAEVELEAKNYELAYRYLALIETLHPESRESAEVFPVAAALFQKAYFAHRYTQPDSVWLTSEPGFMFQWLARFFGNESPQPQAEALFVGMPYGIFRAFTEHAARRPDLSGWILRAEKDNGIIRAITAERTGSPGA